jgi:hypothetical protein
VSALADRRGDQVTSLELTGDWVVGLVAEVDDEDPALVTIIYTEGMDWHAYSHVPEIQQCGTCEDPDHAGGHLRDEVPALLATELRRLCKNEDVQVDETDAHDEAIGSLDVSLQIRVEPPTLDALAEAAWPFIATLINVFDPGTFNAEYVMGNVANSLTDRCDA